MLSRSPRGIVDLLAESAGRHGTKAALIAEDEAVSYRELMQAVVEAAQGLQECGVRAGDRVMLYAHNSRDWVVGYYAVLMAGAVVNPVNALLSASEAEYIARDCGARVLLGTRDKLEPLRPLQEEGVVRKLVCFEDSGPSGVGSSGGSSSSRIGSLVPTPRALEETCTIAYTSGTTGHPKGAMQSQRNVLLNAQLTAMMHGRRETDVVVTALPLPHVYGTVVMNSTLLCGGTLVLHRKFEEAAVLESIARYGATMFEGVPTMFFYLLNHPGLVDAKLSSLRLCTVGGQSMPVAKMQEVEARFGCPLVELWGMTELAGLGTTFAHTGPVRHGSIGVPLPYCQAKIVDVNDTARELEAGEAGELVVKGPVVMQGYYGNETATREAIEADGWLHTGDIARMDEDGFVYIEDRKKDMILTAGYNVYPAEIERVMAAHPDVAMVAVGPVPDAVKGELPKAYVVLKSGRAPAPEDLIIHCRQHLAAYKVPRAVKFVPDLPKTSTGKILRRKLSELDSRLLLDERRPDRTVGNHRAPSQDQ